MKNINVNNIFADRKTVWALALFSLLAIVAYFVLVKHDLGKFSEDMRAIKEQEGNMQILGSVEEYKKTSQRLNAIMVRDNDMNWLMNIATDLAKGSGVTLEHIKPAGVQDVLSYRMKKISISGESSYEGVFRYVLALENYRDKGYIFIDNIIIRIVNYGNLGFAGNTRVDFFITIACLTPKK